MIGWGILSTLIGTGVRWSNAAETNRTESTSYVQKRSGLPNLARVVLEAQAQAKAGVGHPARIVFLGGSATKPLRQEQEKNAWPGLLADEIRRAIPGASFGVFNHGLARSDSTLGACRTQTDVVQHYMPLALVVVEFAVDDADQSEARLLAAMEGIVRQIRSVHPYADIVFVYAFSPKVWQTAGADPSRRASSGSANPGMAGPSSLSPAGQSAGKPGLPPSIVWHERVAEHYGIPSVNVAQLVADQIAAGKLKPEEYSADGLFPSEKSHRFFLEAFQPLLEDLKQSAPLAQQPGEKRRYPLPAALSSSPMDKARLITYELAAVEPGWRMGQENPVEEFHYTSAVGQFRHLLIADQPGPTATFRFYGSFVGIFGVLGPDSGDLEYSLDGGPWQLLRWFRPEHGGQFRPQAALVADGLDPKPVHELKLRVAAQTPAGSQGRTARIGYFLLDGRPEVEDPYRGLSTLQRIDAIYRAMEPVRYTPPVDRWKYIPQTIRKLQQGPELRIVMLGDSIVNDTASSQYELLLGRLWPNCKITKIVSVRGSTGCWWYKEENRVDSYVLQHKPDLVMIGGISQRDDVESIREVIRQVRTKSPDTEFMLITPVFGAQMDPKTGRNWTPQFDPAGQDYRARLYRLAQEEKAEFLDMTAPWGEYIRSSDKCRGWFMRDPVHANHRGAQILGRILELYFSPKPAAPEPKSSGA
ncbi:MAG: SGNH/GDSL hydrolase family protein [Thermoguttaceae bacterium]|nr:SGNH/GDSL hydrolase family protein [Thermoguttaceae bacterium]MDW8038300.1 SGNH/GDSL hydrolase family protein [Thermoguttaceae bacterium]